MWLPSSAIYIECARREVGSIWRHDSSDLLLGIYRVAAIPIETLSFETPDICDTEVKQTATEREASGLNLHGDTESGGRLWDQRSGFKQLLEQFSLSNAKFSSAI